VDPIPIESARKQADLFASRQRRAWLAVAGWVVVILLFSGDEFSAGSTSQILEPLLRWLFPDLGHGDFLRLHLWVRKLAHLTEYALLGLLAFRALRLSLAVSLPRTALLGLVVVLAVAATDELRQSFLASRTGSIIDVGIDFAGGALGVCLIIALHRVAGIGAPSSEKGRARD
jgi:VanZ family protein